MINRVILIVIDSVGIGEMEDAYKYGDSGCNTLSNVAVKNGGLNIPNLVKLGIGNIEGVFGIDKSDAPIGDFARLKEKSNGKDTITGHWEMTGIYTEKMFRIFPEGFPERIINEFIKQTGVPGVLGNVAASGTEIIEKLGKEHMATRKPIVYTSADSVFQIACHEEIYSPEELYRQCEIAREILRGEDEVARIIARPFIGKYGEFERTSNRRDFAILPDENNLLYKMKSQGLDVIAVGKIEDIFAKVGITEAVHTKDNQDGMDWTVRYMKEKNKGLIFTNLVEFDSKWGHRNDYVGYGKGLEEFDLRLPEVIEIMREDDILIITADHGCDPTVHGTDHTREHVPLIVYGAGLKKGVDLKTRDSFADIGASIAEIFNIEKMKIGESFLGGIL